MNESGKVSWSGVIILVACALVFPPLGLLAFIVWVIYLSYVDSEGGSRGPHRTSRMKITMRIFATVIVLMIPFALLASVAGAVAGSAAFVLVGGAIITAIFIGVQWLFQRVFTETIFRGRNESYDQFRDSGGDPFWDGPFIAGSFNPDSDNVRYGGMPEPEYQDLKPDPSWDLQCDNCGAMVPHDQIACWRCGYNWGDDWWQYKCKTCGVRTPTANGCWNCGAGHHHATTHGSDGTAPIDT